MQSTDQHDEFTEEQKNLPKYLFAFHMANGNCHTYLDIIVGLPTLTLEKINEVRHIARQQMWDKAQWKFADTSAVIINIVKLEG